MGTDLILALITNAFTLVGSGGIAVLLTLRYIRRKAKAESEGAGLDNIKKAVDIWKGLTEESRGEVQELKIEVRSLKEQLRNIQEKICLDQNCNKRIKR